MTKQPTNEELEKEFRQYHKDFMASLPIDHPLLEFAEYHLNPEDTDEDQEAPILYATLPLDGPPAFRRVPELGNIAPGTPVKIVFISGLSDVGISTNLEAQYSEDVYEARLMYWSLENYRVTPLSVDIEDYKKRVKEQIDNGTSVENTELDKDLLD